MLSARRFRTLIVALLIAAHPASAAYAAGMLAQGSPCPVHAALLASQAEEAGHAGGHHHHGSSGEAPAPANGDEAPGSIYGFNCCAGHFVGVNAPAPELGAAGWIVVKSLWGQSVPAQADRSATDPPPRFLL
jgi:hypothetical protein